MIKPQDYSTQDSTASTTNSYAPVQVASSLPWIKPLHWVGYGLLLLSLLNLGSILVPLKLMDPAWELQTIGALVELAPMVLVGFVIVFLVDRDDLRPRGKLLLTCLSWLALGIGILYLLLVPLTLSNTMRVYHGTNQDIATQVQEKQKVIRQVRDELNQAKTAGDLEQLINSLSDSGLTLEAMNAASLEQAKQKLAQEIDAGEQNLTAEAQQVQAQQIRDLFKAAVKWGLGALISGFCFISIWRGTGWVRQRWSEF